MLNKATRHVLKRRMGTETKILLQDSPRSAADLAGKTLADPPDEQGRSLCRGKCLADRVRVPSSREIIA